MDAQGQGRASHLEAGDRLLFEKYELIAPIAVPHAEVGHFELWECQDDFGRKLLAKTWRYEGERPDDVQRALWDRELRQLYRLSSAAGADAYLVVLVDAGLDRPRNRFVLISESPGFTPVSECLAQGESGWLLRLADRDVRNGLWRGLARIGVGLDLMHRMGVLHRALSPSSIYVERNEGPDTFRLGGFEWSVRLGRDEILRVLPHSLSDAGLLDDEPFTPFTPATDWFMFATAAARLLLGRRDWNTHEELLKALGESQLDAIEKLFLQRLLNVDRTARLRPHQVCEELTRMLDFLDEPLIHGRVELKLGAVIGPGSKLTSAILERDETILADDLAKQVEFLLARLNDPVMRPYIACQRGDRGRADKYFLVASGISLALLPYRDPKDPSRLNWHIATVDRESEFGYCDPDDQRELPQIKISVFPFSVYNRNRREILEHAISWTRVFPARAPGADIRRSESVFHDFLRITNQLDLLLTDAELFGYRLVEKEVVDEQGQMVRVDLKAGPITIESDETIRTDLGHEPLVYAQRGDTMAEYVERQAIENGELSIRLHLGDESELELDAIPEDQYWEIIDRDIDAGELTLRRPNGQLDIPERGILRSRELRGQIALLKRRKDAIERLRGHGYLLRALRKPDEVKIHSPEAELPDSSLLEGLDVAKRQALKNIWQTRPIFALQGPPGTGKTTLVSHLLLQVLIDDPVSQVLVTAQAHDAVDVLRRTVDALFRKRWTSSLERPIAIRLPRTKMAHGRAARDIESSVTSIAREILEECVNALEKQDCKDLRYRWKQMAAAILAGLAYDDEGATQLVSEFKELVKNSANITYCSTTAGDLAQLARVQRTFDWSIIEEAGKAHGFELILPLQTGHRWVMIGDHDQLPPYRHEDFLDLLGKLDHAMEALHAFPDRRGSLVDRQLVRAWRQGELGEEAKKEREDTCRQWLKTFHRVYTTCEHRSMRRVEALSATGPDTISKKSSLLAYRLTHQHRMHPTIADLISVAYYDSEIISETRDEQGLPRTRVVHPFITPVGINGKAIVWIDIPWARATSNHKQHVSIDESRAITQFLTSLTVMSNVPIQNKLRLAVLSPYQKQVRTQLTPAVRKFYHTPPNWLDSPDEGDARAFTVDSFQGNQADIVIISLVRNNMAPHVEDALAFLRYEQRMNVLLSRAERLLVLAGSWEFFWHHRQHEMRTNDKFRHWEAILDYLAGCFENGNAIRLPAAALAGGAL